MKLGEFQFKVGDKVVGMSMWSFGLIGTVVKVIEENGCNVRFDNWEGNSAYSGYMSESDSHYVLRKHIRPYSPLDKALS